MKTILILTAILAIIPITNAKADVYVNGYVRGNGTYVEPYVRADPCTYTCGGQPVYR